MLLSEKIVNTDSYAGTVDIITGIDNFESTCTYNEEFHTYRLGDKICSGEKGKFARRKP